MSLITRRSTEEARAEGATPPGAPPAGVPGGRPGGSTFAALAIAPYRLLWAGGVFSFLAVQMQIIARGWLAYDLTGSNAGLGAVYLGFGVPMLLLTPWGGVVADRMSKRQVILASQLLLALSAAAVGAAVAFDALTYWMLIASAALQAAAFSFLGPARMAFTGELVGRQSLSNAIVLQQMSMNGTRIFGPSLAGLLIGVAWFGPAGVYFLTAALTAVASAVTFRLPPGHPAGDREQQSPGREMADGLRYARDNPHLLLLLLTSLVVVMTAFPYMAFLPTLAEETFDAGASGYGLMSGATAIGAVAASLLIAKRAGGPAAGRLQVGAGLAFAAGLVLLTIAPSYGVALVVLVLIGGAAAGFQSLNNSMVLMGSDFAYHGRMQSLMMLSVSGFGMMALPLGAFADAVGLDTTLALMGVVTAATVLLYAVLRGRLDRRIGAAPVSTAWAPSSVSRSRTRRAAGPPRRGRCRARWPAPRRARRPGSGRARAGTRRRAR
ncbi:MAG TPA: MFS transporter [Acidimicrobiales bacterium]|nr:MFS transporter [Acidimicrobiales bacterium]